MAVEALLARATEERRELVYALNHRATPEDVLREAADVANFLMMVAENYSKRFEAGDRCQCK